jgi:hypothetical protein
MHARKLCSQPDATEAFNGVRDFIQLLVSEGIKLPPSLPPT